MSSADDGELDGILGKSEAAVTDSDGNTVVKNLNDGKKQKILAWHTKRLKAAVDSRNQAYWERNQLVAALSRLYPAWLGYHKGEDWEDDWRTIVFIKIPIVRPKYYGDARNHYPYETVTEWKQLSWHIHDSDKKYFEHLDPGLEEWDGHTTEEKYDRLASLTHHQEGEEA